MSTPDMTRVETKHGERRDTAPLTGLMGAFDRAEESYAV
jgi:hypothetical protein